MAEDFIQFAFALSPDGPGKPLADPGEIIDALAAASPAWVHLQADDPAARAWIATHLRFLPESVREALTAPETRPRFARHGDGALLNLRGINLNPGASPEDMISLRIYADPGRVITLTKRPLRSVAEIAELVATDTGPGDSGDLVVDLVERLSERIAIAIAEMDRETDGIEDSVLRGGGDELRPRITDLRAAVVDLRRFVLPHRDAVVALAVSGLPMIDREDGLDLGEAEDTLRRAAELIDTLRDRLAVLKDELASQSAERLNRNLYILSVVSAVFLPLGFFTGLMGINLAGMPGASWPLAFWVFSAGLVIVAGALVILLTRLRFLGTSRKSVTPPRDH